MNHPNKKSPIICICNNVDQQTIERVIIKGCKSIDRIFDATSAGVGPCGGSCRPILKGMLEQYLKQQSFPDDARKKWAKK